MLHAQSAHKTIYYHPNKVHSLPSARISMQIENNSMARME